MNAIRLGIVALVCSSLLVAPFLSSAQTNNNHATAAFPNGAATASYGKLAAAWQQELGLPDGPSQTGAQEQVTGSFADAQAIESGRNVRAFFEQDMAFSLDQAANGQQQKQPSSGNDPSLEGLGFPPSAIRGSAKEQALLNQRSHMLQIHQKLGLLTAIPMFASLFTGPGAKGHHGLPGSPGGRNLHMGLGMLTTGLYFSTAYFAIRAPKVPGTQSYGLIRLHKTLAWIHGPGMILTPILGAIAYSQLSNGERVHGIAKYHSLAAVTTAAAYGAAILSITLK